MRANHGKHVLEKYKPFFRVDTDKKCLPCFYETKFGRVPTLVHPGPMMQPYLQSNTMQCMPTQNQMFHTQRQQMMAAQVQLQGQSQMTSPTQQMLMKALAQTGMSSPVDKQQPEPAKVQMANPN